VSGDEVLRSPDGHRFRILRGTPEGDEVEALGAAIDRLTAWDHAQQPSTWATTVRPGIGLRAWTTGSRWGNSLRASWDDER
jgi:hypothetical protein